MSNTLATIAESSNLLLGIDRKLSRDHQEATPLPQQSPIPNMIHPINSGFGETTRLRRNAVFHDARYDAQKNRMESSHQFIPGVVCDGRPTEQVLGGSSRLVGRAQMLRRAN